MDNDDDDDPSEKSSKGSRKRIKKPKFSAYDVRVLEDWYASHLDHPYPNSNEKKFNVRVDWFIKISSVKMVL